jgi:hypothetical protein
MDRRAVFGLSIVVLALGVFAAGASAKSAPARGTFLAAQDLAPSKGGPAGSPRGYLPLNVDGFTAAKARANAKAPGGGRGGGGKPGGGGGSGATVTSYANISPSFNGIYQTGGTPPDTTGAAGPDRYIEAINTSYAIYGTTGSLINSGSLSSLTGISGGIFGYSLSDPQMMWDAATQRFYYSAVFYDAFLSNTGLAVGWSKTAAPASSSDFCKYTIGFGADLPDYPKLGDSQAFLMMGYNLFSDAATTYAGSEFATVNKPAPGSACAPTSQFAVHFSPTLLNADSSPASTPVPANLVDDGNGAGYVVANADLTTVGSASFASIWSVTTGPPDGNGIPTPAISGPVTATVPTYSMPASARQSGSTYLLDTLDGRFEASVAATDPGHANVLGLWTAHAVFGGAGSEERWYEINPATGALVQSGTVGDPSLYTWNGAVSPDRAHGSFGDSMAMSVSTSSSTTDPAIQVVWKKGASAQSPMKRLVQSPSPNVDFSCSSTAACRWGDYSGASPDPSATTGGRVWLANQYNLAAGKSSTAWRTWVARVTPTP